MADTFGKEYDAVRTKLAQYGYVITTLAGSQSGTVAGTLYLNGRTSEIAGLPIPADSTVYAELTYSAYISDDAPQAGRIKFAAVRVGSGNVALLNAAGAGTEEIDASSATFVLGTGAATVTVVPAEDTTNQGVTIAINQTGGTDTSYVRAIVELTCVLNASVLPPYEGGSVSPFGVS